MLEMPAATMSLADDGVSKAPLVTVTTPVPEGAPPPPPPLIGEPDTTVVPTVIMSPPSQSRPWCRWLR